MTMPKVKPRLMPTPPQVDGTGQLFTAALLAAAQGQCECDVCKLLRKVGTQLTAQLIGKEG